MRDQARLEHVDIFYYWCYNTKEYMCKYFERGHSPLPGVVRPETVNAIAEVAKRLTASDRGHVFAQHGIFPTSDGQGIVHVMADKDPGTPDVSYVEISIPPKSTPIPADEGVDFDITYSVSRGEDGALWLMRHSYLENPGENESTVARSPLNQGEATKLLDFLGGF